MQERLQELLNKFHVQLRACQLSKEAEQVRTSFLGKSGALTEILRDMKSVSADERPLIGKMVNETREQMEQALIEKLTKMNLQEMELRMQEEVLDITLPAKAKPCGALHPITLVKKRIINTFAGMGFSIAEGPEIETDFFAFEALNIPKDHPARDMQDTFYITDNILLRPHTSPMQIRTMQKQTGAIRILCPGRVYRADDDATHSPVFHQVEGLVVDRHVTLCDLKGLLDTFAKSLFSEQTKTRFRPSYFPFTEPSVEVDVSCTMCGGAGCKLCKGTGWIEILGAGIVNRNVLRAGNVGEQWSGLAFGMGLERIAMIAYGIPDMRLLYANDIRLLQQFETGGKTK